MALAHRPPSRGAGLPQPPTDAGRHAAAGPAGTTAGQREAALCAVLQLTGRKALQARWRREAADALRSLDAARAEALRQQVAHLQFLTNSFQLNGMVISGERRTLPANTKETAMKHDHFIVQSPATPAQQLLLLFHGVGDNPVSMGQIGSWFAPQFPDALIVSIGGVEPCWPQRSAVVFAAGGDGRESSAAHRRHYADLY